MPKRPANERDVFEQEDNALSAFHDAINSDAAPSTEQLEAFAKNYSKLLKTARRMVRVADRNEAELRRARVAADDANKAKAQFLAAMSHEIRTPMNGVVGMIDILQRTALDAEQSRMATTIKESAFSLLHIINDILDFSKIEAGKLKLEIIPVDLVDVLEGVVQTLLPNADGKGLRLELIVAPSVPRRVMTDPVRLRQILFNLAGNAIKFTEPDETGAGTVRISVDPVSGPDSGPDTVLRFSVQDTGIGIAPEALDKLFEPFTQAEGSTTRRFGGTGLGLTISKNLCDLLGGEIGASSEPGKGSDFFIVLPLEICSDDAARPEERDLSGLSISINVSDPAVAGLIETYVGEAGAVIGRSAENDHPTVEITDDPEHAHQIMIASQDQSSVSRQMATAPLLPNSLLLSIAIVGGLIDDDRGKSHSGSDSQARTAPSIDEAERAGALILVAEDNKTNQDVIRRQLALLGFACEIADDGQQALQMLDKRRYAMLLTDCHMPNLDGYELATAIRDAEADGDTRLPIIAITASALQGEAEKCLAAGMNDYLTKPLEMDKLDAALSAWTDRSQDAIEDEADQFTPTEEKTEPSAGSEETPVVDVGVLGEIFGDDENLLREIFADFVGPTREIVEDINSSYATGDTKSIGAAAHKLKSSARAIGANTLADICAAMEIAGKANDLDQIETLYEGFQPAVSDVEAFIQNF